MKNFVLHKKLPKILTAILLIVVFSTFTFTPLTSARTVDEIEEEIQQKSQELEELNASVNEAQSVLAASTEAKNNAQGKLKLLEAEIAEIEDRMEYNRLKTEQLEEVLNLKKLEMEVRDEKQDRQIKSAYLNWKSSDYMAIFFGSDDFFKSATYYDSVANEEQSSIEALAQELHGLESEYDDFVSEKNALEAEIDSLMEQKKENEAAIAKINQNIENQTVRLANAQNGIKSVSSQIDSLHEEQKILQEFEELILSESNPNANITIEDGELYFTGRGRDLYQGHGIGLSQNGALGASLAGWTYKQIIEFYYPGSTVVTYQGDKNISVQGNGTMDIDAYLAGLGEVPDNGCEDLGVDFGQNGYWYCWPKEAIKAQIVAARSYALTSSQPICTTAACQVYNGGNAKADLVAETAYEVPAVGGTKIRAYYSSQNNQGYGTANNDTVWANREGNGSAISYLRSVNDNGFYYPANFTGCGGGDCARWTYSTNSYTYAEIQGMLEWSLTSPSSAITSGDRTFISGILDDIGELNAISFERDPSNRVNKVVLTGTNGSRKMGGWFFKSLWNIWVDYTEPDGSKGFIYSLTFFFSTG